MFNNTIDHFAKTIPAFFGTAAFVGAILMPSIGVINAIALVGFNFLLCAPLFYCGSSLFDSIVYEGDRRPIVFCLFIIVILAISLGGTALSQMICDRVNSLDHFSYLELLKFSGIHLGAFALSILASMGCALLRNRV